MVVYLLIPTSNHNSFMVLAMYLLLYIFWFLHQTTTHKISPQASLGCISFDSYIKPQLAIRSYNRVYGCISFDSYIKPQPSQMVYLETMGCISFDSYIKPQLYLSFLLQSSGCISFDSYIKPQPVFKWRSACFVVYLLIPTSNHNLRWAVEIIKLLYIFWFLHQTTTLHKEYAGRSALYIFWFLHQTTTYRFEIPDFQCITITFSNKKWWVGYNF